jgi:transcriptional regulator with XRE-family HTH domain
MTFGEKLKQVRTERGLSQQELAKLLSTSKQVISRYELGQTTPKIGVAAKWCQILGVNLDNMLDDNKGVYDPSSEISEKTNKNTVLILGRDGTRQERRLTDEQMEALRRMIEVLPDFKD